MTFLMSSISKKSVKYSPNIISLYRPDTCIDNFTESIEDLMYVDLIKY